MRTGHGNKRAPTRRERTRTARLARLKALSVWPHNLMCAVLGIVASTPHETDTAIILRAICAVHVISSLQYALFVDVLRALLASDQPTYQLAAADVHAALESGKW